MSALVYTAMVLPHQRRAANIKYAALRWCLDGAFSSLFLLADIINSLSANNMCNGNVTADTRAMDRNEGVTATGPAFFDGSKRSILVQMSIQRV